MKLEVLYGVKAVTLETANELVEKATAESSIGCESGNYGNYYRFGDFMSENMRLIQNEDMYDGEPAIGDADDWKYVLILERAPVDSKFLAALDAHPQIFVKLKTTTY